MNTPRSGKPLLVLDIDHTLYDNRATVEVLKEKSYLLNILKLPLKHMEDQARPYLHIFLTSLYQHYDIAIWRFLEIECN